MSREPELFVPGALWKRPPPPVKRPLKVLSAAEQKRVAANKAAVHLHMPDMEPFIKELYEAGLIDGWRSVGDIVFVDVEGQSAPKTMITLEGNGHHGTA